MVWLAKQWDFWGKTKNIVDEIGTRLVGTSGGPSFTKDCPWPMAMPRNATSLNDDYDV